MLNANAAQAFTRFGLGGRPDDTAPADPVGWLIGQINTPDTAITTGLPNVSQALVTLNQIQNAPSGTPQRDSAVAAVRDLFAREVAAFHATAVLTKTPFRERLVWFWANHFALQSDHLMVGAVAGAFVREAIRPNIAGTFSQMLRAVITHPGMLYGLDNHLSIGPQSVVGLNKAKKNDPSGNINENLGRELLELHTVGVDAGYTQADVDAMAMLLTGFKVNTTTLPYGFFYNANMQQPGNQTVMGRSFPGTQAGCLAALDYLATHPATYNHLATKLVRHFVSDTPAPADVATVAQALAGSGGSLAAAAAALVRLPSAWTPLTKFRTPLDFTIAALRAIGLGANNLPDIQGIVSAMGQPTWLPPFPNGWSDLAADWTGPEAMLLRLDWVNLLANSLTKLDPAAIAATSLGPFLSAATQAAMNGAGSVHDRFVALFCSPEFQRR